MKVILVSTYCSDKTYESLFLLEQRTTQQYQKYMKLIVTGLLNNDVSVSCITVPPINRSNCPFTFVNLNDDEESGIHFKYVNLVNIPLMRNITAFLGTFWKVLKAPKGSICVQDLLNVTTTLATFLASRLSKKKMLGILTDMPNTYVDNENKRVPLQKTITQFLCEKCPDYYLFLTEEMNAVVNKSNKPYTIIEGFSDYTVSKRENRFEKKTKQRICMYAGGINKLYGLDMLVNGFISADVDNCELHLYGDGPYVEELKTICKIHKNIKYLGILNNLDIVKKEEEATLLINPRYTSSEFVKYSFPSKNMEYMASGTPILTTKLPGMPPEYYDYVFLIEDETESGMATVLQSILSLGRMELHSFGTRAKKWIIENKNNVRATIKIIDLVKK